MLRRLGKPRVAPRDAVDESQFSFLNLEEVSSETDWSNVELPTAAWSQDMDEASGCETSPIPTKK